MYPLRPINPNIYALTHEKPGFSHTYDDECRISLNLPSQSSSVFVHRPITLKNPKIRNVQLHATPDKMLDMTERMQHGKKYISDTARGMVAIGIDSDLYVYRMKTTEYPEMTQQLPLGLRADSGPISCVAVASCTYHVSCAVGRRCYIVDSLRSSVSNINLPEKIVYLDWKGGTTLYIVTTCSVYLYHTHTGRETLLYRDETVRLRHLDIVGNSLSILTDSSLVSYDLCMHRMKWIAPVQAQCVFSHPTTATIYTGGESAVQLWNCNGTPQAELVLDSPVLTFGVLRGSLFCGTMAKIHCLHACESSLYSRASVALCHSTENIPNHAYGMRMRDRQIVAHTRREELRIWDAAHFVMGEPQKKTKRSWESALLAPLIR